MSKKRREDEDDLNLGPCCVCERTEGVRNIVMLDKRAPIPGTGWGCVVCGLPPDGASAVLCDDCLEKPPRFACKDYPGIGGRIPIDELTEKFEHDYRFHSDEIAWFRESPDAGHPKCICSFCYKKIDEPGDDDPGPIRITRSEDNTEARFHQVCFEMVKDLFR